MTKLLQHPQKHCNLLRSLYIPSQKIPGRNNLTGSLPDEIGLLKTLTSLYLTGWTSLYLTGWKSLYLNGLLKGSIPTTLGMMQKLGKFKFVPIVVNFFSGLSYHSKFSPLARLVTFSFQRAPDTDI